MKFFFPEHWATIEAETLQDAEKQLPSISSPTSNESDQASQDRSTDGKKVRKRSS